MRELFNPYYPVHPEDLLKELLKDAPADVVFEFLSREKRRH